MTAESNLLTQSIPTPVTTTEPLLRSPKLWMPKRVVFTADALKEPFGQAMYERLSALHLPIDVAKNNRITGLRGADERETYRIAKNTLAVVNAPPGAFRLQPIPPSADWQMNLAEGCPAHCHYCYLAGSLSGPPVVRAYANLPKMLEHTATYEGTYPPNKTWQGQPAGLNGVARPTTFEVSCYTDVLGIEHLTGSLAECIRYFGTRENAQLRFVSKYGQVDSLLDLPHNGQTRARFSLNAESVARRLEGGTASVEARLQALRKLAMPRELGGGGYPVGIVLAPLMPIPDWRDQYSDLLDRIAAALDFPGSDTPDWLNVEFISHRFTPGSKDVLMQWYPNTSLEMDETTRAEKRNKFGGTKYVYLPAVMKEMKAFFYEEWQKRFPNAPVLYWT
ncbi:spore photoproduct lyase [Spirosoma sp. LMG 31448]|uniref:Spore photoproduct lyase n=2 Tax=Spirosoma utsteinense TaxID=2585773 RepID=A0ABR6W598_9BACT|nr:radical SAM protein [Spirosoma utsteinense]MBC3785590.1 spore photoproduct lyase [Spirosoma utsteinense]MBC3791739.1 spore photoproduct lyase [Spirosoma utsteinense]